MFKEIVESILNEDTIELPHNLTKLEWKKFNYLKNKTVDFGQMFFDLELVKTPTKKMFFWRDFNGKYPNSTASWRAFFDDNKKGRNGNDISEIFDDECSFNEFKKIADKIIKIAEEVEVPKEFSEKVEKLLKK